MFSLLAFSGLLLALVGLAEAFWFVFASGFCFARLALRCPLVFLFSLLELFLCELSWFRITSGLCFCYKINTYSVAARYSSPFCIRMIEPRLLTSVWGGVGYPRW